MRRWASAVTEIAVGKTEPSYPVTRMKLERLHVVHLGNRGEISHMNSNQAKILAR